MVNMNYRKIDTMSVNYDCLSEFLVLLVHKVD